MVTGRVVSRGFLGTSGKAKCQGGCCGEMLLPRGYRLDPALRKVRMPTDPQSYTHFAFPHGCSSPTFHPFSERCSHQTGLAASTGDDLVTHFKAFLYNVLPFPTISPPRKADWRWALPEIPTGLRCAGCPSCITALGRREIFTGKSE